MNKIIITTLLLLMVFVLTGNFVYAQNATQKTQTDTTKPVAVPVIYIGNNRLSNMSIDRNVLLANPFLTAKAKDEIKWNVESYQVTFVRKINGNGVEDPPITVNGAEFTGKIKWLIQSAPPETMMEIRDVRIQSSAGTRTIVAPFVVRIK